MLLARPHISTGRFSSAVDAEMPDERFSDHKANMSEPVRRWHTPNTAHANAKQRAQTDKLFEGLGEARAELKRGDEDEIGHKWPFAAKAVREDTDNHLSGCVSDDVTSRLY